jgi:hypothetical protein
MEEALRDLWMRKKETRGIAINKNLFALGLIVLSIGVYAFVSNSGTSSEADFDSAFFSAQGASGSFYTRTCTWVSYVDVDLTDFGIRWGDVSGEFWPQNELGTFPCTDRLGNFDRAPPDCETGDTALPGIYCHITDIDPVEPLMAEVDPNDGVVKYPPVPPGNYEGRDFVTSGICERVCKAA